MLLHNTVFPGALWFLPSDKYGYKYEYKNISGKVLSAFAVFEYNVFVDADVAPR